MGKLAAEFALKFPEVRLEVTTEDRPVDMVEEAYDLVIRVNPAPDESLVGRIFLHDRLVVVAAPDLPLPDAESVVPVVVRGQGAPGDVWSMNTPAGNRRITVNPVMSLSSLVMVRDAVRAGTGASRLPVSLVGRELATGTMVHWGDVEGPDIALWALYPTRRLLSARVTAFLNFLKEAFPQGSPDELAAYIA